MKINHWMIAALLILTLTACSSSSDAVTVPTMPASTPTESLVPANQPTATETLASAPAAVSFAADVMPILRTSCLNCHGGEQTRSGFSVASYDALMRGGEDGAMVIPGSAADSILIQLIQEGKMPKRGPKLTAGQLQVLMDWINNGALNN